MGRLLIALVFGALTIGLSACSQGGQLTLESNNSSPGSTAQEVSGLEFTSSSAQYVTSLNNGYIVQQSVGDFIPEVVQTSTVNNYKFYSTVQGQLISSQ